MKTFFKEKRFWNKIALLVSFIHSFFATFFGTNIRIVEIKVSEREINSEEKYIYIYILSTNNIIVIKKLFS